MVSRRKERGRTGVLGTKPGFKQESTQAGAGALCWQRDQQQAEVQAGALGLQPWEQESKTVLGGTPEILPKVLTILFSPSQCFATLCLSRVQSFHFF